MTDKRKDCPMRHENGNCTVVGGFCTAVNDPICDGLHNAYNIGYLDSFRLAQQERDNRVEIEAVKKDIYGVTGLECCRCNPGGCSNRRKSVEDNMKKQIPCPKCEGYGIVHWSDITDDCCRVGNKTCPHCNGTGWIEVQMTNADRIRTMSDDELAEFLEGIHACSNCMKRGNNCFPHWDALQWLQQPVEEE